MTTLTFTLRPEKVHVLVLDKNICTFDGKLINKLEALDFMQQALEMGCRPEIETRG